MGQANAVGPSCIEGRFFLVFCSSQNAHAECQSSITSVLDLQTSITDCDSTEVSYSNPVSGVTGCVMTSIVKSDDIGVTQPVVPADQDFIVVDETCTTPGEKTVLSMLSRKKALLYFARNVAKC